MSARDSGIFWEEFECTGHRFPKFLCTGFTLVSFPLAVNRRQLGEISKDTRRGSGSRRGLEFAYVYVEAYRSLFVTVIDESGKSIKSILLKICFSLKFAA